MISLNIFLIVLLLIFTAFFVATEFAIVRVRSSRVEQLCAEGNRRAEGLKTVTTNLDEYLSACQLGITMTSLGLGWLGEPTVERLLHPLFEKITVIPPSVVSVLSFLIAFFLVTFLHVVLGELAPKTIAINKAENVALFMSKPIIWFDRVTYPLIWLLNGSANAIIHMFGMQSAKEHEEVPSEDEIKIIMTQSMESGEINAEELQYLNRIFEFDNRLAHEIMVPRTDMVCLSIDDSFSHILDMILQEEYTRFPVIAGDKDQILGFINTKEIFIKHYRGNQIDSIQDFIKKPLIVPESIFIKELLVRMQRAMIHIAILIDEYGGTVGMVTIEDILEEIVGEIRDEFDAEEGLPLEKIGDGHYLVQGNILLNDFNRLLDTDLSSSHFDTLGGWLSEQGVEIAVGNAFEWEKQIKFIIQDIDGYRIMKVDVFLQRSMQQETAPPVQILTD